jgi:catechol 2,3-dioxygenase-like lactoylglutathione lyase family enzyme
MIRNPDHVTLAVADADAAIAFFGLLDFHVSHVARIEGGEPAHYMGMDAMQADHITLALDGSDPRFEIQLLHFDEPVPGTPDGDPTNHRLLGFNHLALRVDDLAATTARLEAEGVAMLSDEMDYISRRLRFLRGPEGITIELVEWVDAP